MSKGFEMIWTFQDYENSNYLEYNSKSKIFEKTNFTKYFIMTFKNSMFPIIFEIIWIFTRHI